MLVRLIYQNFYDFSNDYDSSVIGKTLSESDWEEISKEDYYELVRSVAWFNDKNRNTNDCSRIMLLVKPTLNELSAAKTIKEFQKEIRRQEIEEKQKRLLLEQEREKRSKDREQKRLKNKVKRLERLKKELEGLKSNE